MTRDEIQVKAGILALACGTLGQELATRRLDDALRIYHQLGAVLTEHAKLQAAASELMSKEAAVAQADTPKNGDNAAKDVPPRRERANGRVPAG